MLSKPAILLRLEGACVFLFSLFLYRSIGGSWELFFLLFLWPDISMFGYWINARADSALYNLVHTYAAALTLAAVAFHQHHSLALGFALIWIAHVGLDRALGYGLKYPTFFQRHASPTRCWWNYFWYKCLIGKGLAPLPSMALDHLD